MLETIHISHTNGYEMRDWAL